MGRTKDYSSEEFYIHDTCAHPDPPVTITIPRSVAVALRIWIGVHAPYQRVDEVDRDMVEDKPDDATKRALVGGLSLLYDRLSQEGF